MKYSRFRLLCKTHIAKSIRLHNVCMCYMILQQIKKNGAKSVVIDDFEQSNTNINKNKSDGTENKISNNTGETNTNNYKDYIDMVC